MKKSSLLAIVVTFALGICTNVQAAPICQPTGFVVGSVNMTAAIINPHSIVESMVDATGCNIGIYYNGGNDATIDGADISGASHYGILVNTDNGGTSVVRIANSIVHHIGDEPHSSAQYGIAISLRGFAGTISGEIDNNQVFDYQKGGVTANGPGVSVYITNNTVIGDGHATLNAQNGIQVAFGAYSFRLRGNYVFGNSYRGDPGDGSSATGILIAGGASFGPCPPADSPCDYSVGIRIIANSLWANDVGVYVFNADVDGNPPAATTIVRIARNTIYGDNCYNTVFQAGISDVGNTDRITGNTISGPGYLRCASGTTIDIDDAVNPIVRRGTAGAVKHPTIFRD